MSVANVIATTPDLKGSLSEVILQRILENETWKSYLVNTIVEEEVLTDLFARIADGKIPNLMDMPGCSSYIFETFNGLRDLGSVADSEHYNRCMWEMTDTGPNIALMSDFNNLGFMLFQCVFVMCKLQVDAKTAKAILLTCVWCLSLLQVHEPNCVCQVLVHLERI